MKYYSQNCCNLMFYGKNNVPWQWSGAKGLARITRYVYTGLPELQTPRLDVCDVTNLGSQLPNSGDVPRTAKAHPSEPFLYWKKLARPLCHVSIFCATKTNPQNAISDRLSSSSNLREVVPNPSRLSLLCPECKDSKRKKTSIFLRNSW